MQREQMKQYQQIMKRYRSIAFQGMPGAFSDLACRSAYPDLVTVSCLSFDDAFHAVREDRADLAMIPVDNTLAGRVADVHFLMPNSGLHIIAEHFQPVRHCLLGLPGTALEELTDVYSHVHALPQCRHFIKQYNLTTHVCGDTARGASDIRKWNDKTQAAIASELAARIYDLEILEEDIQDADHNTTRFLVLSRDNWVLDNDGERKFITSFVFEVRNIPAALYKALGGFATNNVQMTKLESYVGKYFNVARFYADVEGHIEERSLRLAFEELEFFAKTVAILGTYPAHPFRFGSQE
jgi:prephenate dehydratase